jgi:hypothetical protein
MAPKRWVFPVLRTSCLERHFHFTRPISSRPNHSKAFFFAQGEKTITWLAVRIPGVTQEACSRFNHFKPLGAPQSLSPCFLSSSCTSLNTCFPFTIPYLTHYRSHRMYTPETPEFSETSSLVSIHECFAMFFFETLGYCILLATCYKPSSSPKKNGGLPKFLEYDTVMSILFYEQSDQTPNPARPLYFSHLKPRSPTQTVLCAPLFVVKRPYPETPAPGRSRASPREVSYPHQLMGDTDPLATLSKIPMKSCQCARINHDVCGPQRIRI